MITLGENLIEPLLTMKISKTLFFMFLFCKSSFAQPIEQMKKIEMYCVEIENNSKCQKEITIDSSKLDIEPYVIKFFRSNKSGRLSYIQFQLLKPSVILKYFYENEVLIKVSGIDQSTEMTFTPCLYFENGKLIYTKYKSVDGDNSGKYFLNKSKEYVLYFLLNNKNF